MVVFIFTGCCAVGSAPALGAGGREFESRHSDHKKSHDKPFINAVLSWLYFCYLNDIIIPRLIGCGEVGQSDLAKVVGNHVVQAFHIV